MPFDSSRVPPHVWTRRKKFARSLRRLLAGTGVQDTRDDAVEDFTWAIMVTWFVGTGRMRYQEVRGVVERIGRLEYLEAPMEAVVSLWPSIRTRFVYECVRFTEELGPVERARRRNEFTKGLLLGRKRQLARQMLLWQKCPWCGVDLPCEDHALGRVTLDADGKFTETPFVPGTGNRLPDSDSVVEYESCFSPAPPAAAPPLERSAPLAG